MKLGAEPKKVIALGALLVVAAISAYINIFSGPDVPARPARSNTASRPATSTAATPSTGSGAAATASTGRATSGARGGAVRASGRGGEQRLGEFRPVFKSERGSEQLDPTKVDPTLRTDLLAQVRDVRVSGGLRNLFQFGQAPPPPLPPAPKIIPKPPGAANPSSSEGIHAPPPKPVKPPPPPIPLRYYGFADPRQAGDKRAFFMEGEEIRIAAEGELIKQRYKVLQVGPRSAVVEDTQFDNRQTLAIQPEKGT